MCVCVCTYYAPCSMWLLHTQDKFTACTYVLMRISIATKISYAIKKCIYVRYKALYLVEDVVLKEQAAEVRVCTDVPIRAHWSVCVCARARVCAYRYIP